MTDIMEIQSSVDKWLQTYVNEPPDTQPLTPSTSSVRGKRTRDMSEPRIAEKRRRTAPDDDDLFPDQSASRNERLDLSEKTRLSHPSQSVTLSPIRCLLRDLRLSKPSILCEIPSAVTLPERVLALQQSLVDQLEDGLIPVGLKHQILATYPSIVASIPNSAYDILDTRSGPELDILWSGVEKILKESRKCGINHQDENAWCTKVIHPVLCLALKGNSMMEVENVQTQTINPDLAPITPMKYRVQKKTDYTFSFHPNTPEMSQLYENLILAGLQNRISQTTDVNTGSLALFSGIEVKPENGGKDEALLQLAIWLAAGLQNTRILGETGQNRPYLCDELHPMVGWTVIGHDWHMYIAYMDNQNGRDTFKVVGPWRVAAADTRDVYGIFKLLRLLGKAAEFGSKVYWPWLKEEILMPCIN
ncbi:1ef9a539-42cc-4dd9-89f6-13898e29da70 [Sclerotinia trifoliorum]|uniref:1ef9a539-42cc-4dd9-89f6-13898e29da70 n=1 Tax=Sclerotinia trifoliorum TaxID=28548 RepID=A0A8H2ZPS0_9HELO|nr:1ef9a539-42cc-4dd9-89f6-13898e29da70 [Sclerotinia trifoliorum]